MSDSPKEVPLTEQLLSIPADYRTVRAIQWADDGRETGHHFIPVGHMMHRAANRILDLERELAAALEREKALQQQLESLLPLLDGEHDGSAQYEDIKGYQAMQIRVLLGYQDAPEEPYTCPIHGQQDGQECPRC